MEEETGIKIDSPPTTSSPVPSAIIPKENENLNIASLTSADNKMQIETPEKSIKSLGSPTKPYVNTSLNSPKSFKSGNTSRALQDDGNSKKSVNTTDLLNEVHILQSITDIEPKGKMIGDQVDALTETIKELVSKNFENPQSPVLNSNINKIARMSKALTNEAEALRESIKSLTRDIVLTKQELDLEKNEDVNFPYHLFLIELIVNKINMKCDCFNLDCNNLVITATFLRKQPITLYDSSYGKLNNLNCLNIGKSALFALTYDKICCIEEFIINLEITKQPPCSNCVTKIAETCMDYTKEFINLREELCKKWMEEQPRDNIVCTTSTPLKRNIFCLTHSSDADCEPIGVIEVSVRMSFLGKEITTTFNAGSNSKCTSELIKEDNGVSMYSCQDVEMDVQGNILLNEDCLTRKQYPRSMDTSANVRGQIAELPCHGVIDLPKNQYYNNIQDDMSRYTEIFTKMNTNELKIRVPKTTKVERMGKYDAIQELCNCESTPYNTGDQIQFDLPNDVCYPNTKNNTYSSNIKYTYKGNDRYDNRDRKIVNVTPTNCPVPINMEKMVHPRKDVFILKIGKKIETKDKKTDLEIELITPKSPVENPPVNNHISQQCSSSTIKSSKKSKKKKKIKKQASNKKGKAKKGGKKKSKKQ